MSQVIDAKWDWDERNLLYIFNLQKGGAVQMAIDNAVASYCMQYTPWRTGTLARSPFAQSQLGKGMVIYDTPYARRLYYNPQYHFDKTVNPLAGGYWFERMKADHSHDILEEAMKVATG